MLKKLASWIHLQTTTDITLLTVALAATLTTGPPALRQGHVQPHPPGTTSTDPTSTEGTDPDATGPDTELGDADLDNSDLANAGAEARRHPDDGYTSEAVIVTALLVAAAIAIIAIIVAKVTARANAIPM